MLYPKNTEPTGLTAVSDVHLAAPSHGVCVGYNGCGIRLLKGSQAGSAHYGQSGVVLAANGRQGGRAGCRARL